MGYYYTSDNERISQSTLDRRISRAKAVKKQRFQEEHGYFYCEDCGLSSGGVLDMSHEISVQKAKNARQSELCYDVDNIKLRCRPCHLKHDNL